MRSIGISKFKAECISILKRAQRTGTPLVITHRGRPLARIEPLSANSRKRELGDFKGQGRICGDIVNFDFSADWEMNRS